jgi:TonB-dependent receptor
MKLHLLSAVATIALAAAAQAQQAAPAEPAPAADDTIVVTGQRAQQERSIEAKRLAIGVIDVAAADEIGRLPDRNVAEVVERLPGVGVTYDQGEGRYVAVRGVPSNLNGYTINGLEIGNPDGTTRSLPLDIVSGQLLNRVEVAKVKTSDFDGQGIGGTINLVTQTAFDYRERFTIIANAQAGKQEFNDKVPVRGDASIAARFGSDEQFGIVLGGSYSDRTFVSYGFYPDSWAPNAAAKRGGAPINIKYTNYTLQRERIGATGSLDWKVGANSRLYVRGLYSRFAEHENRPRYRLDFGTLVFAADGLHATAAGTPSSATGVAGSGTERRVDLRLDDKIKSIATGSIGGTTENGPLTLDYVAGYTRNKVSDVFPLWQFRCNPGPMDIDFTDKVYTATPRTECTANQLQFRQYSFQNQKGEEDVWQGKLDATYRLEKFGAKSFVKAGVKYRATDKKFDQTNDVWDRGTTAATRFTLGQFNLQGGNFDVYPDNDNSDKLYLNAPTIDPAAMRQFTAANLTGPYFVKNVATSLANNSLADLDIDEKVYAAYLMGQVEFGRLTITPGIRLEHTRLGIGGNRLDNGTTIVPLHTSQSYDSWLPSLIFKLQPTNQIILRLAYSRSLGRPEYSQLNPGGTLSLASGTEVLSLGNPGLKPYTADNADFSAEWYFGKGGLLSVGAFAKWVKDPIFSRVTTQTNATYAGTVYPILQTTQPINGKTGKIYGIEAEFQQQFTFLPGLLSGFGVELTATFVSSKLTTFDGREVDFPNQSGHLYGAQLFYQKGPFEASVAYHVTGKALLALGGVANDDQFNNDLRRLDAKASLQLMRQVSIFFEAQNLTDEPTRQYQAGNPDWLIQNERYGRTYYGGVSVKF